MDILFSKETWESLSGMEKWFWLTAIISTGLFLLQNLLSWLGSELEVDADLDAGEFPLFSVKGLLVGLILFGWTGVILSQSQLHGGVVLAAALGAGLVALLGVAYLMRVLLGMQDEGRRLYIHHALEAEGEVYLRIPPQAQGVGKVHLVIDGAHHELEAQTAEAEEIPTGQKIRVVEILSDKRVKVVPTEKFVRPNKVNSH